MAGIVEKGLEFASRQCTSKSKEKLHESFEVLGHLILPSVSRVLDGTVGSKWPDLTVSVNKGEGSGRDCGERVGVCIRAMHQLVMLCL